MRLGFNPDVSGRDKEGLEERREKARKGVETG